MKTSYVVTCARGQIAVADLSPPGLIDEDAWWVHRINVPWRYRGEGFGSELLSMILLDADQEGAELALTPLATPMDVGLRLIGLSSSQLFAWYARHGFEWESNPDRLMRRFTSAIAV
jgi:GNAT superfamily N-acetyltransferase